MTLSKPKLTYFDAPASRGEECRLALHCAGVDFDDNRVKPDAWPALKASTPFGSMPVLEWPGHPPLGQSNAILTLIGRRHGLHPKDEFEAARHEAMMAHVEDLRNAIALTLRMADAEKKAKREELSASFIPAWGGFAEKQIREDGPFFGGKNIHVVDFKIYIVVRWLTGGILDHIPTTLFADQKKLVRVHDAVRDDARIKAWYAKG
jgi:glutathione S-transferase